MSVSTSCKVCAPGNGSASGALKIMAILARMRGATSARRWSRAPEANGLMNPKLSQGSPCSVVLATIEQSQKSRRLSQGNAVASDKYIMLSFGL